jgi:hypothetical protein
LLIDSRGHEFVNGLGMNGELPVNHGAIVQGLS